MLGEIILYVLVFLYGIIIGSFLNVCIYRIPEKENITTERSHCMSCGHKLAWYDLVPVFSWVFLRGKCRYCGEKISIQYPLIELLNGVGYVWIFATCGFNLTGILYALCSSALIVLSVIDIRTFEIPVGINIFILVLGVAEVIIEPAGWAEHLIGMFSVSLFLYILYIITKGKGIGGGDIKLMAAAGLLLGVKLIVLSLILGCVIGSIVHITLMKIRGKENVLAFGPYLSIGIFLSMIYGNPIIEWYFHFFAF